MPNFTLNDDVFFRAAEQFPTPFHLYDEQGIRARARRLRAAFGWCADFREYFAVKALSNPAVLRIMKEEGCGLDCSSATELTLAEACGFRGEEIILSANAMPPEEFDQARALGAFINLDDLSDVDLLRAHGGFPSTVCLRYNPGGTFSIGNTIMGNPGEAKYGFTLPQLKEGLAVLKREGVTAFGLHAFLASNTMDPAYYPGLAELLMSLGRELSAEFGLRFAFVASLITGIAAVVLAFVAKSKAPDRKFSGMALGGLITGIIGVLFGIVAMILSMFASMIGKTLIEKTDDGELANKLKELLEKLGISVNETTPEG